MEEMGDEEREDRMRPYLRKKVKWILCYFCQNFAKGKK